MKKTAMTLALLAPALDPSAGFARTQPAAIAPLEVEIEGVAPLQPIPARFAYCMPDGAGKAKNSDNINPRIGWAGAPLATKSFAVVVVDKDVPKTFELANQEGKTIPEDFPRRDFYHWVLVDIPATRAHIGEGEDSRGVTEGGKPAGAAPYGVTGHNDYSPGNGGYDGPCPPWNDERTHHYHFQVYALDVPSLSLKEGFGGKEAMAAMEGHVLAQGEVVGTYSNNPASQWTGVSRR